MTGTIVTEPAGGLRRVERRDMGLALEAYLDRSRFEQAKELVSKYCPSASFMRVNAEEHPNSDGTVSSTVDSIEFLDSKREPIDLFNEHVAWHIVNSSLELKGAFYLQDDYGHDAIGASDWLRDILYEQMYEYGDLIGETIDIRQEPPTAVIYEKRGDGTLELLNEQGVRYADSRRLEYEVWVSAKTLMEAFVPMAAAVKLYYSAEYDDEGGFVASLTDIDPLDENGQVIDLYDNYELALECINANPELREKYEDAGNTDPEMAGDFLCDQLRWAAYDCFWNEEQHIVLADKPQLPEIYVPKENSLEPT